MVHPILTCAEVREAELRADAGGVSLRELMEAAGAACADYVDAAYPDRRIVVLCGPGNNGGDGLVAAARLASRNRQVVVFELVGETASPEREWAAKEWPGVRQPLDQLSLSDGDVVVDALFGAGLSRELNGSVRAVVEQVREAQVPVVAVDLPSGVRGDTAAIGASGLRAAATVTFGALKPAHVLYPSAVTCGEVIVRPIGFESHIADVAPSPAHLNAPELWSGALCWPGMATHKHARGRLCVVSGGPANTGAARLAAQAGLRSGAGLSTVLCPPSALIVVASHLTAVMCASFRDAEDLVEKAARADAVVIGPAAGVTDATRQNVEALARAGRRLVLDADALTVFADDAEALREALSAECVLTPHQGEFERLFPGLLEECVNKIDAVRVAAGRVGATVLLKGPDTVIATPDGRAVVNTHATPFLATAGSGDVLAGIIGGLMAQGLEAFDAAAAGAWLHGAAGLRAGPAMTAEDLDNALRLVLADLYAAQSGAQRL